MSWHDVIMAMEWCDDLTNCCIYKFVLNLVGNCLYAYLHVVLLPALKICNFKLENLYGMGRRKRKIWIFRLILIVQEKKSAPEISPSSKLSRRGLRANLNEAITTLKIIQPFLQLVAVLRSVS